MALARAIAPKLVFGNPKPRVVPPVPARSGWKEFRAIAEKVGLELFPWQDTASRYLTAIGPSGHPLYREVAIIVARQNGKTTLLMPLVLQRLLEGRRITHAAQHLRLPGEFHLQLAGVIEEHFPELLPKRRGISWRAGQEEIRLTNGGIYRIVAASKGAPRGPSNDLVIIDELREMEDNRFLAAIKPTTIAQAHGQIVYLSNAGTETSAVLNSVKARAAEDPTLAYLEWSAAPEFAVDDERGWLQANPSIGHITWLLDGLRSEYRAALLGGTLASFETEHLCRWVVTLQPRIVAEPAWLGARAELEERPLRPMMAVSMDANGSRASAVIAWQRSEGIGLRVIADVILDPVDVDKFGDEMREIAVRLGVPMVGFDPLTDAALAKHFKSTRSIAGTEFANACATFARLTGGGQLHWDVGDQITEDLAWAAQRPYEGLSGAWKAVKTKEDRPITAVLAAIRAVSLASGPKPSAPKVF